MRIRKMEKIDYQAYCALLAEVHGLHAQNRPDIFKEDLILPDEAEFEAMLTDPEIVHLAADEGGEMIGMCQMQIRMPKAAHVHHRAFGWIGDLCVRSDRRGQGVGTQLYEAMMERARERELSRVELMVWAFNEDAKRFYEKLGMDVRSYTMEVKL